MFINNGDGTFQAPLQYSPFLGGAIAAGDLVRHRHPALVAADSSQDATTTDTLAVLLNTTFPTVAVTLTSTPVTGALVSFSTSLTGESCETPCTAVLAPGTREDIGTFLFQSSPGIFFTFVSWSDGGDQFHAITVPAVAVTYTATFKKQYLLTISVDGLADGPMTVTDGLFDPGTVVPMSSATFSGYRFTGWTGGPVADPSSLSTTVTMTGPFALIANFAPVCRGTQRRRRNAGRRFNRYHGRRSRGRQRHVRLQHHGSGRKCHQRIACGRNSGRPRFLRQSGDLDGRSGCTQGRIV